MEIRGLKSRQNFIALFGTQYLTVSLINQAMAIQKKRRKTQVFFTNLNYFMVDFSFIHRYSGCRFLGRQIPRLYKRDQTLHCKSLSVNSIFSIRMQNLVRNVVHITRTPKPPHSL